MSKEFFNEVAASMKRIGVRENLRGPDSKILIIYAGGTIGMVQSKKGYVPATNIFSDALRKNMKFHDQEEHLNRLSGQNYSEDCFITPESFYKKRIIYRLIELSPLIDSSNMNMGNWIQIAEVIEQNYYEYDGFLVLHGTDTMAYTASILSFILENLQKPVILTGSQIPYFEVRTDAGNNLLEALTIAGHFHIPEVCLYFSNKLFRGNRSTKVDNNGFNSFGSPNCGYLVKSGISFKVKWNKIRHPRIDGKFSVQKVLEENISILYFFPIITIETIRSATQSPTKAVVILSYGAGNIPSLRTEFLEELRNATDRGVILLNITQCMKGGTSSEYECGKVLVEAGVVLGADMTLESAVTKLSYLLGKYPDQPNIVKQMLKSNLRGELKVEQKNVTFSYDMQHILDAIGKPLGLQSQTEKVKTLERFLTMISHNSATDGLIDELKRLSDEGVSMELKDSEGRTILHVACSSGDLKIVEFLLSQHVNINAIDTAGNTPLLFSIQHDFVKISEVLIEKGAEVKGNPDFIAYVLSQAAIKGNVFKVKLLLDAGVNPNLKDFQGRTVAHAAAICNNIEIIELLKKYPNLNWESKDALGFTAVSIANHLGFIELSQSLSDF